MIEEDLVDMLALHKKNSFHLASLTLLVLGLCSLGTSVHAADAATLIAAMDAEREKVGGWIMHVGTTDGQLEADLLKAKDGAFNVTGVALSDQAADKARRFLNKVLPARGTFIRVLMRQ